MSADGRPGPGPDGLLLIDKPGGITSHDAVAAVRRALQTRKVGHAGTLDPMATGLLVMGVGRATRLLRFLGDLPKDYEGTMRLGVETTTLDAEGEIVRTVAVAADDDRSAAMTAKLGASAQRPPAFFSAVKVDGEALRCGAQGGASGGAGTDRPGRPLRPHGTRGARCVVRLLGQRGNLRAGARRRCRRRAGERRAPDGAATYRDRPLHGRDGHRPTSRASPFRSNEQSRTFRASSSSTRRRSPPGTDGSSWPRRSRVRRRL